MRFSRSTILILGADIFMHFTACYSAREMVTWSHHPTTPLIPWGRKIDDAIDIHRPWLEFAQHLYSSTSNCEPGFALVGFGPVAADGYGIGYIIKGGWHFRVRHIALRFIHVGLITR